MMRKTMLVVDDDAKLLLGLQKRLEANGHRVVAAMEGSEALERARQEPIDVILLDVSLPGCVSGLDVAAALRQDARTARIPIVFITGSADESFKQRCTAAGAKYFMAKPYDPELLLQTLRGIFGEDELSAAQRISRAKRRQPV